MIHRLSANSHVKPARSRILKVMAHLRSEKFQRGSEVGVEWRLTGPPVTISQCKSCIREAVLQRGFAYATQRLKGGPVC
ncbi:hypothetical protein AN642_00650 [Epulopiscium sp. SCG-B10WGA-EpuloA2]|nr:hypothetical protein AN642_00650 [Epulopiscium sp. SCG-B10WGA-EpuloA2]